MGAIGWTTPIYHSRANPVERKNQEIKKGLRALLVNEKHSTWDMRLASILFAIRNRRNDQTRQPPSALVFGRECRRPGDWIHPLDTFALVEREKGDPTIRSGEKPEQNDKSESIFKEGDVVFYKAHHLLNASKKFYAGFAPKWWGPVRLDKRIGKGIFLTNQQPPRKIHASCFKHGVVNHK